MMLIDSVFLLDALPTMVGAAAVVPALLVLWLVIAAGRSPQPPGAVWAAFILGAASLFVLRYAPMVVTIDDAWRESSLAALLLAAIPEETLRVFIVAAFATHRRAFADPAHAIVCGAATGLGFAAAENLAYLVHHLDEWQTAALVRGVLTVPVHAALGAIAGAYIAAARFGGALAGRRRGPLTRARLALWAWLIPVALHTLFDAAILDLNQRALGDLAGDVMEAGAWLVGFASIALALHLAWKIRAHPSPPFVAMPAPGPAWRAVWAALILGGGAAIFGAALVVSELQRRFGHSVYPSLGPIPLVVGGALIAIAGAIYHWGSQYLFASAALPTNGSAAMAPPSRR